MKQYFDPFAMIRPQNDRDISAMLAEALAELKSINGHLEALMEAPVKEPAEAPNIIKKARFGGPFCFGCH